MVNTLNKSVSLLTDFSIICSYGTLPRIYRLGLARHPERSTSSTTSGTWKNNGIRLHTWPENTISNPSMLLLPI